MVKRATTVFLVLLILLVATAPAWAKVTIKVYHRDETREAEWMKQVEADFEAANPDIDVELVQGIGGGGSGYAERLAVLIAAGTPPDVFYGSTDKAGYILNGWAMDVTNLINRDRREMAIDDFFPGAFDASVRNGRNMGVPAIAMGQAIFYNKRLFAESGLPYPPSNWDDAGWNWNDFVAASQKLTKFASDGQIVQAGFNEINKKDLSWQFGGDWFAPEAYITGIAEYTTLASTANVEAYTAVQQLYAEKRYAAAGLNSGVSAWDGFWNGKIGMDWAGWWKVRNFVEIRQGGSMAFEWGIAPVPMVKNRANTRWSDPWFISSSTKHPEEAWRFIKFVTGRQGQTSFAKFVAFPPSRQSAVSPYIETVMAASGMTRNEVLTAISGAMKHSRVAMDEVIGGVAQIEDVVNSELDPALQGQKPIRATLEALEKRINPMLKETAARWKK